MDLDDLERMMIEIATKRPPSLNTPEANAMRETLRSEMSAIVLRGGALEIPHEIPMFEVDDDDFRVAGGPGSGNFGHAGRPGKVGGSAPNADKLSSLFEQIAQPDGGFTYDPLTDVSPTKGFVLSTQADREQVVNKDDLTLDTLVDYYLKNRDLIDDPEFYLGAWHDPKGGKIYLDVSQVVEDRARANELAIKANQLAYFDLSTFTSVAVDSERNQPRANADGQARTYVNETHRRIVERDGREADGQETDPGGNQAGDREIGGSTQVKDGE